ncbi:MAG: amino acid ABC transporter permease, partial [Clostridiales bacterium]
MDTSFWAITLELFKGFWINFKLFGITLLCALPLGLILSFGSMSKFKPLKYLVKVLVWIIRGTPLMLQIIVVFYGPGLLFGMQVGNDYRFKAALIAFIINYSCYFSEIYRGGIESIPKGQQEAGLVLGMTKSQIFFKVTLLQVVKNIVPPMSNEIITLVKDTS